METIFRIDLNTGRIQKSDGPKPAECLGGREYTSTVISEEVDPLCHPLSAENKLVMATGTLGGTSCPSSGRVSFGTKSPLTGGIKESNVGGPLGIKLARLGVAGVIIEGTSEALSVLVIDAEGARLEEAKGLRGALIYETTENLQQRYGKDVAIAAIGPAGETKMLAACIGATDMDGVATRQAGRGGVGAVMGSKNLKAIVVDDNNGKAVSIADPERFKKAVKTFVTKIKTHHLTETMAKLGTAGVANIINEVGAYPTRNFSEGRFENISEICGEKLYEVIVSRGAKSTHRCMPGCITQCSNTYIDKNGEEITGGFEYETLWSMGGNCGISDMDAIALMNRLCDDVGIDTVDAGVAIGVAMEAGILQFGDVAGALGLLDEVRKNTPMGRIIGCGAKVTGEVYGVTRVPAVKGQALPAYDPRAIKGMGAGYALSPMGADHTSCLTTAPEVYKVGGDMDPVSPEGKTELALQMLYNTAVIDATGLCLMVVVAILGDEEGMGALLEMLSAKTGEEWSPERFFSTGKKIIDTELDFNRRAGMSHKDYKLPRFLRTEPLPPHNVVNDVDEKELEAAIGL